MEIEDRIVGSVLGAACGDALGGPLEFAKKKDRDIVRDMVGGGWLKLRPGQTTDDTAMMKDIMAMYIDRGKYDQSYIISLWQKTINQPIGAGSWTKKALAKWKDVDVELRGDNNPAVILWKDNGKKDAGNGSLMRCLPTALFYTDMTKVIEDTIKLSEDTHPDLRCISSCVYYNILLSSILGNKEAMELVSEGDMELVSEGYILDDLVVIQAIMDSKSEGCDRGNGGYVVDTLRSVLADFWEAEDFEEAMIKAVNRGGDADTVGCILGGLLGAEFGIGAIPNRWLDKLQDRDELIKMAKALI
jgi:ADP-ribosyl-[dinitrogen reductase] hydrolase